MKVEVQGLGGPEPLVLPGCLRIEEIPDPVAGMWKLGLDARANDRGFAPEGPLAGPDLIGLALFHFTGPRVPGEPRSGQLLQATFLRGFEGAF